MRAFRVDFETERGRGRDSHRAVVVAPDPADAMRQLREEMVTRWPDVRDYEVGDVGEILPGAPWLIF